MTLGGDTGATAQGSYPSGSNLGQSGLQNTALLIPRLAKMLCPGKFSGFPGAPRQQENPSLAQGLVGPSTAGLRGLTSHRGLWRRAEGGLRLGAEGCKATWGCADRRGECGPELGARQAPLDGTVCWAT